jgi:chromosome partitioning protein
MAIISLINLKGGVGKTTCAVALAETLAGHFKRNILVIDLDPQTNATIALVGVARWEQANRAGQTIRQMFLDEFVPREQRSFTIANCFIPRASNVEECQPHLWVLPSSIDLIGMEALVELVRSASEYRVEPFEVLSQHLTPSVARAFDDILLDCPPSLNAITLNGLFLSDAFLIPVIPEPVSTLGIPQILSRVRGLRRAFGREVPALGILVNRFDNTSMKNGPHTQICAQIAETPGYPPLFATYLSERQKPVLALRYEIATRTLQEKYHEPGHSSARTLPTDEALRRIAGEVLERCAALPTA